MISKLRALLGRVAADANLDLYCLIITALVFTLLGGLGISDVKTLSSAVLALLAFMAFSQIKSRNQIGAIARERASDDLVLLRTEFPEEYHARRARARTFLFVGISGSRTIRTMHRDLRRMLEAGGKARILLLDPTDERLVREAARNRASDGGPERLRGRIEASLEDLIHLRDSTGGDLEVRVSPFVPVIGFNGIDLESRDGGVLVQHYEHRSEQEAAPILWLERRDGPWFDHFTAEARRMWEDGLPWPLDRRIPPEGTPRPSFVTEFDEEFDTRLASARRLFVTGVTRNSLVHSRYGLLERLLRDGCEIRVLLIDPDSPAVAVAAERYYAQRSTDSLRERIRHTLRLLEELGRAHEGLSVRLTEHPLAIGLLAADWPAPDPAARPALFLEYYTYQAAGEPKFTLQPDDPWFAHFLDEASILWDAATPATFAD
ncbi:hypothetical protein [Spirillospora albida]|uniref:hypothetical protein n=1 Tax=Spirillospora albida TaxID=58123 RepID=UPI00068B1E04|nr:hypothetical protein [Spirillospora albida]